MSGHTPGPWHVEPVLNENDEQFWSDDWNGKVFCVCHPQTQCNATTVVEWINEHDANLIAAAPDLLASVIELLEPLERASAEMVAQGKALNEAGEAAFDRARAAIAKAKGEA